MKHNLPIKIELPEHFLEEEVRCGFTVTTQMKKVWAVEIDLLFEFIRICDKYHLRWFAGGGTLIGAARHKGYIPWDDDIDIDMFREDYDTFCEVAPKELQYPYYFQDRAKEKGRYDCFSKLMNEETTCIEEVYANVFTKLHQGIDIDIFPIDDLPNSDAEIENQAAKVHRLIKLNSWLHVRVDYFHPKKSLIQNARHWTSAMIGKILWPICNKSWNKRTYAALTAYKNANSERVGDIAFTPFSWVRVWKREWYKDIVKLPFEWFQVNAMAGYEDWLTHQYGDWKKFVMNGSCHSINVFDPEKSYKNYVQSYK